MKDFTTGNIPRLMFSFLIPLLLSNMLQAVYMLIDAIWAGRLLGPSGVAIVATAMPVMFFLSSLVAGIVVGASILAGQAFGSKNHEALSDIISTSVIGTAAVVLALSLPAAFFSAPILRLINTPAPLFDGARVFLTLIVGTMSLGALGQWFAAMMNAAGDSKTPFRILVVSLAVNAVLAPLLITGAGLIPPLGIAGSAISTITANLVALVIGFFVWRNHRLSKIAPFRFKVHGATMRRISAVGFPLALQMLIVSMSFLFIFSLVNRFGPDVTAAFGIGSRVDQFALLATFAVTAAISAMTAQNVGAGKLERIPEIIRWGLIFAMGISAVFLALVMLFPDSVTALFTSDAAVTRYTRHYFYIAGFSYLTLAVLFAYQGVLRGAGDTLPSFIIIAVSMIFLRVPLCYYLSHQTALKEMGLWIGITASTIFGAAALWLYYRSGRWKARCMKVAPVPAAVASSAWEPKTLEVEESL